MNEEEDLPEDEWDDVYHLGWVNWPHCELLGCGNTDETPGHR